MKFAEKTHISSTFWTERIGPTAAIATLKEMKRIKSWKYVTKYGSYVKSEWSKIFKENNLKTEINGLDSMPVFNFKQKKMNQAYKSFIILEMLKKGFLTSNSLYVSTAHTPYIINKYLKNFSEVIKKLKIKIQNKSMLINTISKQQINR
jgi:glutamate-1-semialdehyde aminotransferase